jgi:hypothetical protein
MNWLVLGVLIALPACEHGKGGGIVTRDGGGSVCGGLGGDGCAADEWCDFSRDDCGASDGTGICRPRPVACDDSFDPVCGCDGVVHSNPCDGQAVGADISVIGGCPVELGFFACGSRQCNLDTQYCQRTGSDIGGEPDGFACMEQPGTCGALATCACLANEPCGTECSGDDATGLTVICFGG